jgi:tetratricopeptide (TPR) repeat protein
VSSQKVQIALVIASFLALHIYLARGSANAADSQCAALEDQLEVRLSVLNFAADQWGGFRGLGDSALEAVKTCQESERLWYLAARSAELLEVPFGGEAFASYGGAKKIAADAAAHAPHSAKVATVLARLDGSVASAQKAYELDRDYTPARDALALALSDEGRLADAMALLQGRTFLEDHLTRARILLQVNQTNEAAAEARSALKMPLASLQEPTPTAAILRDGNEVLAFALLAMGRTREALVPLRTAAGAGSIIARSELAKRR